MRNRKNDVYLGDGLYAGYEKDSGQVVLYSHDGIHATNSVYLEPSVLTAFIDWAKSFDREAS